VTGAQGDTVIAALSDLQAAADAALLGLGLGILAAMVTAALLGGVLVCVILAGRRG